MNTFIQDSSQREHDLHFHYIYRDYPQLHNHDYWEFLVVINGAYKHTLNGCSKVIGKNSAYLIRPGDCHSLVNASAPASHINILIRDCFTRKLCACLSDGLYEKLLSGKELPVTLDDIHTKELFNYTSLLSTNKNDGENYDLVSKMIGFFILEKVIKQNKFADTNKPKWLTDLLQQINSPYNSSWQIEDLLKYTNYSHSYFTRQFNKYMNCPPIRYLTEVKMARACNYLIHSDMSILEIASALGYTNLSHFNHTFKALYHLAPTKYRKNNQTTH